MLCIAGETGLVYKGVLMEWRGQLAQPVAVKTLKGLNMTILYVGGGGMVATYTVLDSL